MANDHVDTTITTAAVDDNDNDDDEYYDTQADMDDIDDLDSELDALSLNSSNLDQSIAANPHKERTLFAVQFVNVAKINENTANVSRIFRDRDKAVKLCKLNADNARFKSFKLFKDAYAFSYENDQTMRSNIDVNTKKQVDAERLPYSQPRTRDFNELRSFIEKSNVDKFKDKIKLNPRYLISSGDTPTVIQEAFRYNSLHICAKCNQYEICEYLLRVLHDVTFYKRLYVNDTVEQSHIRSERILDMYLNTSEKGLEETPLHFACKFGAYEVARLLINERLCSKTARNKYDKTAYDLIGTKTSGSDAVVFETSQKIKSLFDDCFYIPLYRNDENCQVIIEKPVNNENLYRLNNNGNCSPIDRTNRKLAACVGPTSPKNANQIYEKLKSPSRDQRSLPDHKNFLNIIRTDDYKGYERIARALSEELNAPWLEYWEFLDSYCNLKTIDSLKKFEIYLTQKKLYQLTKYQLATCNYLIEEINQSNNNNQQRIVITKNYETLKTIIQTNIYDYFELKENQLSLKFEKFKLSTKNNSDHHHPQQSTEGNNEDDANQLLQKHLNEYFNLVCSLADCDHTSRAYFNLYKISKLYLSLILFKNNSTNSLSSSNIGETFADTYAKPFFSKRSNFLLLNDDNNNNSKNASNSSSSSSHDMAKVINENEKYYNNENCNNNIDYICSKMLFLKISDSNDYGLSKNFKRQDSLKSGTATVINVLTNGNSSRQGGGGNGNLTLRVFNKKMSLTLQNLVIFGENPSKVDHAVYQCLKDTYIDGDKFPLINEWYNYICKFKPNEMEKWKSPIKRQAK